MYKNRFFSPKILAKIHNTLYICTYILSLHDDGQSDWQKHVA